MNLNAGRQGRAWLERRAKAGGKQRRKWQEARGRQLLMALGSQAEESGWRCTATAILQEGEDLPQEGLGGCGVWTGAGGLAARGRNNDPVQKEQCLAAEGS